VKFYERNILLPEFRLKSEVMFVGVNENQASTFAFAFEPRWPKEISSEKKMATGTDNIGIFSVERLTQ